MCSNSPTPLAPLQSCGRKIDYWSPCIIRGISNSPPVVLFFSQAMGNALVFRVKVMAMHRMTPLSDQWVSSFAEPPSFSLVKIEQNTPGNREASLNCLYQRQHLWLDLAPNGRNEKDSHLLNQRTWSSTPLAKGPLVTPPEPRRPPHRWHDPPTNSRQTCLLLFDPSM